MFAYLKILPVVVLLAGLGYAAHKFQVTQLEGRINQLQTQTDQLRAENTAFQVAQEQNLATITNLQNQAQAQIQQMGEMTTQMAAIEKEKNEYLSIFRDHNLYRLARARPGMIEPRINNGTNEVFRQVEQDSREIANVDETIGSE